MPRVPYIEVQDRPEFKEFLAELSVKRGRPVVRGSHMWQLYGSLLYNPDFAAGWLELMSAVRQKSTLNAADQELVIVLITLINKDAFQYDSHAPKALEAGFTQRQLDELSNWRDSDQFSDRQRALLAYADVITRSVVVPDEVFEEVRSLFNPRELVDLTALIAAYNFVARFTVPMKIGS